MCIYSNNVDYANKSFNINGNFIFSYAWIGFTASDKYSGCFSLKEDYSRDRLGNGPNYTAERNLNFNYTLNGMPTSYKETRVKTKFFSLMIYAGYPA